MNFCYKKCTTKSYPFLVNDTTLPSDNPLHFKTQFLVRILEVIMATVDNIKDQKTAKILILLSGKIDKH